MVHVSFLFYECLCVYEYNESCTMSPFSLLVLNALFYVYIMDISSHERKSKILKSFVEDKLEVNAMFPESYAPIYIRFPVSKLGRPARVHICHITII